MDITMIVTAIFLLVFGVCVLLMIHGLNEKVNQNRQVIVLLMRAIGEDRVTEQRQQMEKELRAALGEHGITETD